MSPGEDQSMAVALGRIEQDVKWIRDMDTQRTANFAQFQITTRDQFDEIINVQRTHSARLDKIETAWKTNSKWIIWLGSTVVTVFTIGSNVVMKLLGY